MNTLQDPTMINRLYEASQAGGGNRPDQIPWHLLPDAGQTCSRDCVAARIVDTFWNTHVYEYFGNGGNPELFLGSPDWMRRNLPSHRGRHYTGPELPSRN